MLYKSINTRIYVNIKLFYQNTFVTGIHIEVDACFTSLIMNTCCGKFTYI